MQIDDIIFNVDCMTILTELKAQLKLNDINLLGSIKSSGEDVMVSCPYHKNGQERRPSAGIRKSDGLFHCLACGETHSLPEVVSHCFGYEDNGKFGIIWLLKNFATIQIEDRRDIELDIDRHEKKIVDEPIYVSDIELDKYRYYHPYWDKRGITDVNLIELFDLGYDLETDCITFPIRDVHGNCLFVARRSVKTKYFNYPKLSEKSVYGLYELYQLHSFPDEVWITESMIDALRLWGVGLYACALNGLGSNNQYKQLSSMPCRVFVLATDMDKAGLDARKSIKRNVSGKLFKQIFLPPGRKDIGDCSDAELKNLEAIF